MSCTGYEDHVLGGPARTGRSLVATRIACLWPAGGSILAYHFPLFVLGVRHETARPDCGGARGNASHLPGGSLKRSLLLSATVPIRPFLGDTRWRRGTQGVPGRKAAESPAGSRRLLRFRRCAPASMVATARHRGRSDVQSLETTSIPSEERGRSSEKMAAHVIPAGILFRDLCRRRKRRPI